ncbi:MAG: AmmeMemoRadiSam system protein B [Bacillota bacterium]
MHAPNDPTTRYPVVAGRFYPADAQQCRTLVDSYLKPKATTPKPWIGAVVPHAGWICSGAVAGQAIATLAAQGPVDLVVIFGAIHTPVFLQQAALDSHRNWHLPGGESEVSQTVRTELAKQANYFVVDDRLHVREHAIEVNVPFVQRAFAGKPILPIEVPLVASAHLIGQATAQAIAALGLHAAYIASSDLTHYGPNYEFMPAGVGPMAMLWEKDNDRQLLNLITNLAADRIVPEVHQHYNACGAGAIAALLGACREAGATTAEVLCHTNSYETLATVHPQPPTNAVGYAGVVVG